MNITFTVSLDDAQLLAAVYEVLIVGKRYHTENDMIGHLDDHFAAAENIPRVADLLALWAPHINAWTRENIKDTITSAMHALEGASNDDPA